MLPPCGPIQPPAPEHVALFACGLPKTVHEPASLLPAEGQLLIV
jgi:hypothetical protein